MLKSLNAKNNVENLLFFSENWQLDAFLQCETTKPQLRIYLVVTFIIRTVNLK